MKTILFMTAILATTAMAATDEASKETKSFDSAGLTELIVQNTSGGVTVSEIAAGAQAKITAHKLKFGPTCEMKMERQGDKLGATLRNRGFVDNGECQVDFEIQIPKNLKLSFAMGAGDIELKKVESPSLTFKIGSGAVRGDGRFASVNGNSGSGRVQLKGLTGGGSLKAGSGDFDLVYSQAPAQGELKVDVASGSAQIAFPKGSRIAAHLTSVTGHMTNDLGEASGANFRVSMNAASGDLKIHSY